MPDLSLDLRYLRYAILAAEHGSFRRAAVMVGVNQSTLTRRVQLLERRLGITLFERGRTGVVLTPVGKHFLQEARSGAEQLYRAVKEVGAAHGGRCGQLRIGLMGSLARSPLSDLFAGFRARHPRIDLRVEEAPLEETVAAISNHRLDMAFVLGEPCVEGCSLVRMWDEPLVIAVSAQHRISEKSNVCWHDLLNELFLVSADAFGLKATEIIGTHLKPFGRKPRLSLQRVSRETLFYLVGEGLGVTVAVRSMLEAVHPALRLVDLQDAEDLRWSAIWCDSNTNPALKALINRLPKRSPSRRPIVGET